MRLNAVAMGQGAPVVFLHGLFGAAQNWATIQRRMAGGERRVIALDLRNHGASGHDAAMDYEIMAADVVETLDALGAFPAAILGHSMGGKVAMLLALQRPEAVRRLCVADIAPVAYAPRLRETVAALQAIPLREGLTRREADAVLSAGQPDPAMRAFLLQNLRFEGAQPAWRIGLGAIDTAMPALEGFPAVTGRYAGPTLFVNGGASEFVLPDHLPRIRALFPAARFATMAGAGHWLHAERPEEFIAMVEPFLAG
jgi:pimeloyl-ACP methyl ester carboxylesterase